MKQTIEKMRDAQRLAVLSRRNKNSQRQLSVQQPSSHRLILCTNGMSALVDKQDHAHFLERSWRVNDAGYAISDQNPRRMHRQIMQRVLGRPLLASEQVDHINHNRLDNRRANLRVVTNQQNGFNKRPTVGTSSYKGVSWSIQKNAWIASVSVRRQKIHCGTFSEEIEAAYMYDQYAMQLYGQHAYLNLLTGQ